MSATGLREVFDCLHPTDGQLLARFVATRDEAAFAALVRRHGPMVLGVCRRVLRHQQDAEDAFQATFLVLARKAGSVMNQESVGSFLHGVAHRTALQARSVNARRRARERQVEEMPHPTVAAVEPPDWLPLLDRELGRLPEKYRAAVVLCYLEGRSRREAARQLGVPEGTLSSRLAAARAMLARRLASAAGLAGLPPGAALARVPAPLVWSTARAAAQVAAGQLTAAPAPAVVLMRGVLEAMYITRLKLVVGTVVVVAALVAGGFAYREGAGPAAHAAPPEAKPATELEALRKENELLKLNLQVVLEKVRAQEAELSALKGKVHAVAFSPDGKVLSSVQVDGTVRVWDAATGKQVKQVLTLPPGEGTVRLWKTVTDKQVNVTHDKDEMRHALDALEEAVKKLREQISKPDAAPAP
jgi:RNA polymerase sigma factor (sigma-70 family)